MAITETVRDLEQNPNVTRTVTLDLQSVIPLDSEGDEKYVTSATPQTTAVSKISGGSITPIFLQEFKAGYSKSSGFKNPPFTVDSSANKLQISIDGSSYSTITLSSGIGLSGEDVAEDLQTKISAEAGTGETHEGNLGFLNALVEFKDSRFRIYSGTISNTYTGTAKSSVSVVPATSGDASVLLGFDMPIESETLSSKRPTETFQLRSIANQIDFS